MTGKNCSQYRFLIGQLVHLVGGERGWVKGGRWRDRYFSQLHGFTLLEYMITWCKIKIIIITGSSIIHYMIDL